MSGTPTTTWTSRTAAALGLFLLLSSCAERSEAPEHLAPNAPDPGDSLGEGVVLLEDLSGGQVFPASNWWNLDISEAPVDIDSQAYIDWISGRTESNPGATRSLHPDFGPPPYGIPYVVVSGNQPLRQVAFVLYPDESDEGAPGQPPGYPIPDEAYQLPDYIEGAVPGGGSSGDRHLLVVDRDNWLLFETWATEWNTALLRWEAGSGAVWDLSTNMMRPEGWTSADAAGLAVLPGLIRYEDAYGTEEVSHAFRFTTRATNGYVWPASHAAGSNPEAPPMGTRLRLKAGVDISGYPAEMQRLFRGMKTYGLILADNGSDMYITGTMDPRWDNDILNPAFHSLLADDFEVIQLGWNPATSSAREDDKSARTGVGPVRPE